MATTAVDETPASTSSKNEVSAMAKKDEPAAVATTTTGGGGGVVKNGMTQGSGGGGRWRGVETSYAAAATTDDSTSAATAAATSSKQNMVVVSSINTLKATVAHGECSVAVNHYNQKFKRHVEQALREIETTHGELVAKSDKWNAYWLEAVTSIKSLFNEH